jgi:hypothetical protein
MIPIQNEAEFKRLLDGLADDIIDANVHYKLYKDLLKAIDDYPTVVRQSNTFWSMTLKAHLATSINMLCKAFDQENKSLHLKSWLLTINDNLDFFTEKNFREREKDNPHLDSLTQDWHMPDIKELRNDIALCSNCDPLVNVLVIHRNNIHAHRSGKNTAHATNISENIPLSFTNFEVLLKRAVELLNRYSILFEACSYSTNAIGRDDYKYIFESVNINVKNTDRLTDDLLKRYSDGQK